MKKLLTLCLLAFGLAATAQTTGYKVGDVASDFKLKNINGKTVSFADYPKAKGFIVVFTCNTCPYAVAYEDRIIALNAKYAAKGYPVIAINPNDPGTQPGDSYEKMQQRAKDKGFSFPYLMDPDHVITKQFGASRTPHVFVLQKTSTGNVVQYIGAIDDDTEGTKADKVKYVEAAVEAVATGKKPSVTNSKAIGCTIKWKKQGA
ncbi:thioredoxin family protein [Pedobacter sp. SYSU D00535]|uniref:thioredoxin family protein n=1 Tax=Pedobacter sp. SYSU D00535 TaxID=2810308 RepID=UPI001A9686E7|nr:thioredoxin family protein [Pedobacter sp. SYSU D00535]